MGVEASGAAGRSRWFEDVLDGASVWLSGDQRACEGAASKLRRWLAAEQLSLSSAAPARACCALVFGGIRSECGQWTELLDLGRAARLRGLRAAVVLELAGATAKPGELVSLAEEFRYVVPAPLCAEGLRLLVQRLAAGGVLAVVSEFARATRLSEQEQRLLAAAVSGLNNDEAADELGCSRATIGTYWNRIFQKTAQRGQRDVISAVLRRHVARY